MRTRRRGGRGWRLAAGLGILAAGVARGQGADGARGSEGPGLDAIVARSMVRAALFDLRAIDEPQPRDYAIAATLMESAERLVPQDAEVVRRRIEAAANWGNAEVVNALTRRLLQLDPQDTVAQLRYIASVVSQQADQTVEGRLRALEGFAGSARLDASVRSRLALDAAMLARDTGDDARFASLLKQAVSLDGTNKEAALLALSYYDQRVGEADGRLELLSNLLYADPLDPNTHSRLCKEMASAGAYGSARRFNRVLTAIRQAAGFGNSLEIEGQRLVLDIGADGPTMVHQSLLNDLSNARRERAREIEIRKANLLPVEDIPPPDEVRLTISFEPIRYVTAVMMGDEADARSSIADMGRSAAENAKVLSDPLRRPASLTEEQAATRMAQEMLAVQLWRGVSGYDVEALSRDLQKALDQLESDEPLAGVLKALAVAREGDLSRAGELLEGVEENEWSLVARGVIAELGGKGKEAAEAYAGAHRKAPLTSLGLLARYRSERLTGGPTAEAQAMRASREKVASSIPAWVDQMARDPKSFQSLTARVDRPSASAVEWGTVEVALRNVGQRTFGVGAGRTMSTRLELAPAASYSGRAVLSVMKPEVVDLERRLRLGPREEIRVRVDPEVGVAGWVSESMSASPGSLRWRVIQGFEIREGGAHVPGAGCVETTTEAMARPPLAEARLVPADLASRLTTSGEKEYPKLLVAARAQLVALQADADGAEKRGAIVSALAQAYPTLTAKVRTLIVASFPPGTELEDLKPLDAAIEKETDPEVLAFAVVTRASSAESPLLKAALESGNERTRSLAGWQGERLAEGGACYAKNGSGLVKKLVDVLKGEASSAEGSKPAKGK